MNAPRVCIIGGGLAGLACAGKLAQAGIPFRLLEASDRLGGRVRTDVVDGFTLDHGFQVLLTSYPACRELLDYSDLHLRYFQRGAYIRWKGSFRVLGDPFRRPADIIPTLRNPTATLGDKLKVARMRWAVGKGSLDDLYARPQMTSMEYLQKRGFSQTFIDSFFRPFFGGVFLESNLETPSRMLEFVFRMFAQGDIGVPAAGMQAIPHQLAAKLPSDSLRLSHSVAGIDGDQVVLSSGNRETYERIVIATEAPTANRLLPEVESADFPMKQQSTSTFYFQSDSRPLPRGLLVLAGDESKKGPINHLAIVSNTASEYAPQGKSLICANVLGNNELTTPLLPRVQQQLVDWFGGTMSDYRHLRTYSIPHALPQNSLAPVKNPPRYGKYFVCGDHRETASLQGALSSGMCVGDAVLKSL